MLNCANGVNEKFCKRDKLIRGDIDRIAVELLMNRDSQLSGEP